MASKTLIIDPLKCNGCKDCEVACSVKRFSGNNPEKSCIRIISEGNEEEFFLPMACQQCEDPPCMNACPRDAIRKDDELNIVVIDSNICVGCKMCIAACPFGAVSFDEHSGQSYKCDLCGGDPACVYSCNTGALTYSDFDMMHFNRAYSSASTIFKVLGGKHQVQHHRPSMY